MKTDFYTMENTRSDSTGKFLFTENISKAVVGESLQVQNKWFTILSFEWTDEDHTLLKAMVVETPLKTQLNGKEII